MVINPWRPGSVIAALLLASPSLAQQATPPSSVTLVAPVNPGVAPAHPLALPPVNWTAAAQAEGITPNDGLAGDPDAPGQFRLRPPPAEIDSYLNSEDYQKATQVAGGKGHRSALKQFAGAGEAALGQIAILGGTLAVSGN